jgi:hypothetical protein
METLSKAMGHASIATTVDLYGHLDLSDVARDLARRGARNQSRAKRGFMRAEARTGFEPVYEALQASA